jgi:hypothetical protein
MKILAIADTRNRPFRRDGDEFRREARAFTRHWESKGADVTLVETKERRNWKKYRLVLKAIRNHCGQIDVLAMFCHGWHDGISLGFRRYHITELTAELSVKNTPIDFYKYNNDKSFKNDMIVLLYACKAFKKENSFGPVLSYKMTHFFTDSEVIGHSTSGHTTRNPFVWNSIGGNEKIPWIPEVALGWWKRRKSPKWKSWCARLKTTKRFDFWA